MRVILGDQSVVITKVLMRRTCGFAVFRVLVRARCKGAASASLRACVCLFLWEQVRDREQSQTRENYFEVRAHLLYVPAFNTIKNFNYNRSHRITRRRNTYKEFPLELLDSLVPLLFPQEQTHAGTQGCRGRTELETTRTRKSASSKQE